MNVFRHILAGLAGIATYLLLMCLAKPIHTFIGAFYASGGRDYAISEPVAYFITMAIVVSIAHAAAMFIAPGKRYIPAIVITVISVGAMILAMTIGVNWNIIGSLLGTLAANVIMIIASIKSKDERL